MNHPSPVKNNNVLVVLLHAFSQRPERLQSVKQRVAEQFTNATFLIPKLPLGSLSLASPDKIVADVVEQIDTRWSDAERKGNAFDKVILIGHSFGALLVRRVYIEVCTNQQVSHPWAKAVDRIVLLAGMNRGWQISHHLSFVHAITWTLGTIVGRLIWMIARRPPVIFQIRRGAPFLTRLRVDWISMRNNADSLACGDALTIQLLGSIDDMVSPEDNIDLVSGRDFIYMDVPYSGHASVIDMHDTNPVPLTDSSSKTVGEARTEVFVKALTDSAETLQEHAVLPTDLPPEEQRWNVTDVVFVIHGIRDKGYWTHKVARKIMALARQRKPDAVMLATETSSYGYFPMLPFLLPGKRREKVEWLMDQYAEALARYPRAEFSFVGHSNGTYLLAKALQDYPQCRFKHVVLAGSVIATRYDWAQFIRRGQVRKVLNYVATADWVVAFFPKAIEMLRLQDLGSAGHDGFRISATEALVEEIRYVKGGHGAALREENWDAIAHFVLDGTAKGPPQSLERSRRNVLIRLLGFIAPAIWIFIAAILWWGYWMILNSWQVGDWYKAIAAIVLTWFIWKIITRL